jgi:hypothetical protein
MRKFSTSRILAVTLVVAVGRIASATPVTVRVVSGSGKDVAGATVVVSSWSRRNLSQNKDIVTKTDNRGMAYLNLKTPEPGSDGYSATIMGPDRSLAGGPLKMGANSFRLEDSRRVTGNVVDESGKAVASARVSLQYIFVETRTNAGYSMKSFVVPKSLKKLYSATSDREGRWHIDGIPKTARPSIELDDERFAVERNYGVERQTDSEILLTARPGAVVEGRVVDSKGKAVPHAMVYGGGMTDRGSNYAFSSTDIKGNYRLTGLLPTEMMALNVRVGTGVGLVSPLQKTRKIVVGVINKMPDIVMVPGISIEGTIKDETTKDSIAGASVHASLKQGGKVVQGFETQSLADGTYRLRVLPGDLQLSVYSEDANYRSGRGRNKPVNLKISAGQKPKHDFLLQQVLKVEGVAVDEKGKPLAGATFGAGESWSPAPVKSGKNGHWSAKGVNGDFVTFRNDGEWVIKSAKRIRSEPHKPIRVVLRRANYEKVVGRVVAQDGSPLPGVTMSMNSVDMGPGSRYSHAATEVKTGKDGRYEFTKMVEGQRPMNLTARLENHLFVSGPGYSDFKKRGKQWICRDVVLAKFVAPIRGRVLLNNGSPAVGAYLVADKGGDGMIRAGEDGTFKLNKMIAGSAGLSIFCGDEATTIEVAVSNSTPEIIVSLQPAKPLPPRDLISANEILIKVANDKKNEWSWGKQRAARLMLPFDKEMAERLNKAAGGTAEIDALGAGDEAWRPIVAVPEEAVDHAEEYVAKAQPQRRKALSAYLAAMKGLALVPTDTTEAKKCLTESEAILRGITTNERSEALSETIQACALTGALASKLKLSSAQTWCDFALTLIEREVMTGEDARAQLSQKVLSIASRGGAENYERYEAEVSPGIRLVALGEIIRRTAVSEPSTALAMFQKMEALPEEKRPSKVSGMRISKKAEVGKTIVALVKALAAKEPAKSLALARRVPNAEQRVMALAWAARGQTGAAQSGLFSEAFNSSQQYGQGNSAKIAAMAYEVDEGLGKRLFGKLISRIERRQNDAIEGMYMMSDVPEVAFYLGRFEPAAARRLIERAFAKQKSSKSQSMNWQMYQMALAMAPVDLKRAVAMAGSISESYQSYQTLMSLAAYALASDKQRQDVTFQTFRDGSWRPANKD